MQAGVAASRVFLLFLSEGVLTRPFCMFEIDTALQLDKGDWKELGCAGLKAAKVMGALAKLEAGVQ